MTLKNKIRFQQAERAYKNFQITKEQFTAIYDECHDEQAIDTINLAVETKQIPSTSAKKKSPKAKAASAVTTNTVVAPDLSTAHVIDGTPNHPALPGLTATADGTGSGNA